MTSPKIDTFRSVTPFVYSWRTPDVPKYDGWEKIGYTEQASAAIRIAQQASQMSVIQEIVWSRRALFTTEAGGRFTDREFHTFLDQRGVQRETEPKRTEWYRFAPAPRTSLEYFNDFAGQDFSHFQSDGEDDYVLRPEQLAAVDQALAAFNAGSAEVLWNAKPRFGKTLTTYDLMRELDVTKALIVTNRPAIGNSWFDDFARFIGHQTTFKFVSDSASLAERFPMSREQWRQRTAVSTPRRHRRAAGRRTAGRGVGSGLLAGLVVDRLGVFAWFGDQQFLHSAADDGADDVVVLELDAGRAARPQPGHLARADHQARLGKRIPAWRGHGTRRFRGMFPRYSRPGW